ncbi:hypothetical protein ACH4E7_10010, partial [Kitasatospora sp. NPDC018058]|uniref:hypothetical protein n=1 Tax=Kitasatospora sp. NPDC018058 TaxID=3364025 RepID=UPI0037C0CAFF
KILPGGGLALGTDLTAFYRAPGETDFSVLGRDLPTTSVQQLKTGPDGRLYAATFGRGIWSIDPRELYQDNDNQH